MRARVITVSDRCATGERADRSGPLLVDALRDAGYTVDGEIVPDGEDSVHDALIRALTAGAQLVVTTGGTGVAPRDRTPEGTRGVLDRELPGIAEALRAAGVEGNAHARLGRGVAGVVDPGGTLPGALIVNLPGSPDGAREGITVLLDLVPHVLDQLAGGDHR